jgi:aminoglycoside phosphotransferase (APT) family kinase protein
MPHAEAAEREIAVQTLVAETGYPTPRVRLSSPPTPQLDRAWSLMDFVRGSLPLEGLSGPALLLAGPRMLTRLPDRIARLAAALHALDPQPLADLRSGADEFGGFLAYLRERAEAMGQEALMDSVAGLEASRPAARKLAVCHGDFHPFNVLSGPDGEVVLDWTAALIADPLFDVAFSRLLFAYLPVAVPRPVRPLVRLVGGIQARRFLSRYQRDAGERIDRDLLAWYTRFHATKMLIEVEERKAAAPSGSDEPHPYEAIRRYLRNHLEST